MTENSTLMRKRLLTSNVFHFETFAKVDISRPKNRAKATILTVIGYLVFFLTPQALPQPAFLTSKSHDVYPRHVQFGVHSSPPG